VDDLLAAIYGHLEQLQANGLIALPPSPRLLAEA